MRPNGELLAQPESGGNAWLTTRISNAGRVVTQRQLPTEVLGPSYVECSHYWRIHIQHLRHKLERDPAQPEHLLTELGVGYRFYG